VPQLRLDERLLVRRNDNRTLNNFPEMFNVHCSWSIADLE